MSETTTTPGIDPTLSAAAPSTDIEAQKARLDTVWQEYEEVKNVPELMAMFDRTSILPADCRPEELLAQHAYPERSKIANLDMGKWRQNLDPRFVKDGFMYLFRGDNPAQGEKGFYARTFGYGKKSTEQLAASVLEPAEVGYVLYGDDRYLSLPQPHGHTTASEFAYLQSARGGSSFISTTTSLEVALRGTGNNPTQQQKDATEIYVLRVPVDAVINSNTGNFFGLDEDEVLVADYVLPSEVIGRFAKNDHDKIHDFMRQTLGEV